MFSTSNTISVNLIYHCSYNSSPLSSEEEESCSVNVLNLSFSLECALVFDTKVSAVKSTPFSFTRGPNKELMSRVKLLLL